MHFSFPSRAALYCSLEDTPVREMLNDPFINYSHPGEQISSKNRRKVAQYIGTHYRNRSAPVSRRATAEHRRRLLVSPCNEASEVIDEEARRAKSSAHSVVLAGSSFPTDGIPRDRSGTRQNPFGTFPIELNNTIAFAIDYCRSNALDV